MGIVSKTVPWVLKPTLPHESPEFKVLTDASAFWDFEEILNNVNGEMTAGGY